MLDLRCLSSFSDAVDLIKKELAGGTTAYLACRRQQLESGMLAIILGLCGIKELGNGRLAAMLTEAANSSQLRQTDSGRLVYRCSAAVTCADATTALVVLPPSDRPVFSDCSAVLVLDRSDRDPLAIAGAAARALAEPVNI